MFQGLKNSGLFQFFFFLARILWRPCRDKYLATVSWKRDDRYFISWPCRFPFGSMRFFEFVLRCIWAPTKKNGKGKLNKATTTTKRTLWIEFIFYLRLCVLTGCFIQPLERRELKNVFWQFYVLHLKTNIVEWGELINQEERNLPRLDVLLCHW